MQQTVTQLILWALPIPRPRAVCFKLAIKIMKDKGDTASIITRFGYRIEEGVITEDDDRWRPVK